MSASIGVLLLSGLCVANAIVSQIKLAQGIDPTSMSITWSTDIASSGNSHVIYGTSKSSLSMFAEGSEGKAYTYQSFDSGKANKKNLGVFFPKYTSPNIHSVRLNNLVPGTTYYYRCGDTYSSDLSSIISFTTLPAVGSLLNAYGVPLTFAVMADTSLNGVVNGTKYVGFMNLTVANIVANPKIGIVFLPGDLGYADCNAPAWDIWDTQNSPMTQQTPFMVSAGNHEQEQEPVSGRMYTAFEARYVMPRAKPAVFGPITINSLAITPLVPARPQATFKCQASIFNSGYDYGNSFYSFNAGLAHVIFLNAYTNYQAGSNQYNWLVADLAKVDRTMTPWIIVNFHTPWYNTYTGKHNEMEAIGMKKAMEDLFYKNHVNAAFSGHVHAYERFLPMYKNVTTVNATIYMTVGTGGQSYDGNNFVGQGPLGSQESYNSVSTRDGTMYGYGTFTINSATVATWNMFKNSMTASPGQTNIDSLLICNSYMTGSAICPFTSIPVNAAVSSYSFSTVVFGVTAAQAMATQFQTTFITTTAAALGLSASAVTIKSITTITARRKLAEVETVGLRILTSSSSVKVLYSVSTADSMTSTTISLANSGPSMTINLNNVGASNGFVASVSTPTADGSTLSPTQAPAILTPASCFAGSETVSLESGDVKLISDVVVGDRVLASSASGKTSFSDVIYVPHGANKQRALFTHITTESGRDLKMTQNHILPSGACGSSSPMPLVYASSASVGDCVMTVSGEEKVTMVGNTQGEGVYTIVTNEEYVVVNGIIASPFGANHMMANMYYNIHRFVYSLAPALLASNLLQSANEGLGMMIPLFGSV